MGPFLPSILSSPLKRQLFNPRTTSSRSLSISALMTKRPSEARGPGVPGTIARPNDDLGRGLLEDLEVVGEFGADWAGRVRELVDRPQLARSLGALVFAREICALENDSLHSLPVNFHPTTCVPADEEARTYPSRPRHPGRTPERDRLPSAATQV